MQVHGRAVGIALGTLFFMSLIVPCSMAQLVDTDHSLTYFWTKPADDDVVGYVVHYSMDGGSNWTIADTVQVAEPDTTYYTLHIQHDAEVSIRVQAIDIAGHCGELSGTSDAVISDTAPPGAPGQPQYVDD
jgi:hypothetical protein